MKIYQVFFIFFFFINVCSAQTFRQYMKAADNSFEEKNYYAAMKYYQDALEIKENDTDAIYRCAESARLFFAYETAEIYFQKLNKNEINNFPLYYLRVAQVKQTLGKYEEAEEYFNLFIEGDNGDGNKMSEAILGKKSSAWAKKQEIKNTKIKWLGKKINSPYSEFAGSWMGDTLYYSTMKYEDESVKEDRRLSKMVYTDDIEGKGGRLLRLDGIPEFTSSGNASFNSKGDRVFFTVCDFLNDKDLDCKIYKGEWTGRKWLTEKIEGEINGEGFTSTHPFYSEIKGWEGLFFSSDREEGKGGLDIWFSKLQGGEFITPINIKEINTPYDEITPSIDVNEKNKFVYFSSNGRVGFGGFDIFRISLEKINNEFLTITSELFEDKELGIENLGRPINTGYNDVYYWQNKKMGKALLSSNRLESRSMTKDDSACCNDLYGIDLPKNIREEETIVAEIPKSEPKIKNDIPEPTAKPIPEPKPELRPTPKPIAVPAPSESELIQRLLPVTVYFDNDEPDKRTNAIQTQKNYTITYLDYLKRENIFYEKNSGIEEKNKIRDFFNNNVRQGFSDLDLLSSLVLSSLQNGKFVELEIKGYTSPRAKSAYNDNLAKRRISSLINHFLEDKNGVFRSYLDSGKLVLRQLPLGERTVPFGVNDSLSNEKESIYSVKASIERRAEIVAVKIR